MKFALRALPLVVAAGLDDGAPSPLILELHGARGDADGMMHIH